MFTDIVLMKQSIGCARKLLRARKLALKVLAIIYGKKLKNMVSYFSNVNAKDIIWLTFFDTNWIGIFSAILRLCMEMKRDPNQREIYDDEVVPGKTLKDVVNAICKVKLMEMGQNANERLSPNSIF